MCMLMDNSARKRGIIHSGRNFLLCRDNTDIIDDGSPALVRDKLIAVIRVLAKFAGS